MKLLTQKQVAAVARRNTLPRIGQCKIIRKVGKAAGFGTLPRGVTVEICRDRRGVTANVMGPKRKALRGARRGATNNEGLTLPEWVGAARYPDGSRSAAPTASERRAWRAGEDPTDHVVAALWWKWGR